MSFAEDDATEGGDVDVFAGRVCFRRWGGEGMFRIANIIGRWRRRRLESKLLVRFVRDELRLRQEYFDLASSLGKPRGLKWSAPDWRQEKSLMRERANGQWWMLAGVNLSFEAVVGGEMEGVEAVSMLREACAVFVWFDGGWRATGRTLFNMDAQRAVSHLEETHEPVAVQ
ncbi:MAG: hypothetical protein WCK86_00475 [Planctomycetia bacterium]